MATEVFDIKRAQRSQVRLRLGVSAPSGAGKTWWALVLARGLVQALLDLKVLGGTLEGKIGLIDTERKSAQLYAPLVPFDTIELGPPFTVPRYLGALHALERAGCEVIILDSISHAWVGPGGILALLDSFKGNNPNDLGAWIKATPLQDEFVDALLRSPAHIIATMRAKTAWEVEEREIRGVKRKVPVRVGKAPMQRPGIEYEFTTLLELRVEDHAGRTIKNRCPVFVDGDWFKLGDDMGARLAQWLHEGAVVPVTKVDGTPLEEATAVAEALERALERAVNLPDLARVFSDGWRHLMSFKATAPLAEHGELCIHAIEVKDRRKAALGGAPAAVPAVEGISPDEVAYLEAVLPEAKLTTDEFKSWAGLERLHQLPAARWTEALLWISTRAGESGVKLTPPSGRLKAPAADPVRGPLEVIEGTIQKEAGRRGGLFSDMKNDIPF